MSRYHAAEIVSEEGLETLNQSETVRSGLERVREAIRNGGISLDVILGKLTKRAYAASFTSINSSNSGEQTFENILRYDAEFCENLSRKLTGPNEPSISEEKFIAALKEHLKHFHQEDVDLTAGLAVMFRMTRHFAAFPFDPSSLPLLDLDGFIRAIDLISNLDRQGGMFMWSSRIYRPVGRYKGFFRRFRHLSHNDQRRWLFRSIAVLNPTPSEPLSTFRSIPVDMFTHDILGRRLGWTTVMMQTDEDERQVDLLDTVMWASEELVPAENDQDYHRCCFLPVLDQDLPTYRHYLDELVVPTKDLKELIKVMLTIKFGESGLSLPLAYLDRHISFLPTEENLTWEKFNEIILSNEHEDIFEPLEGYDALFRFDNFD